MTILNTLNSDTLAQILQYLNHSDLCHAFILNKFTKNFILRSPFLFEIIYFNLLYERSTNVLLSTQHHEDIDHYLTTYYNNKVIYQMLYQDYKNSLLVHSNNPFDWKKMVDYLTPFISKTLKSSLFSLELMTFEDQKTMENRSGHASEVVTCPLSGHDCLILICGASNNYSYKNSFDLIDLTTNKILFKNAKFYPSQLPHQWLFTSVTLNNFVYVLTSIPSSTVYRIEVSAKAVLCHQLNTVDPDNIGMDIGGLEGASMIMDPIPMFGESSKYRCFVFGGFNLLNRVFHNKIFLIIIDLLNPNSVAFRAIETTGEKPSPRYCHATQLVGRKMYIFGGWSSVADTPTIRSMDLVVRDRVFFNDLFSFDLDTNVWTRIITYGIPPSPRCQSSLIIMPCLHYRTEESPESFTGKNLFFNLFMIIISLLECSRYLVVVGGANHDIRVSISVFN